MPWAPGWQGGSLEHNATMDEIVKQALLKWPNVPACYGWLGLDNRGRWYLRDDATQAQGAFPAIKGSWLQHEKLIEFIHRNYESDALGQWYFQNGPQRVYVELESTPWIWRVDSQGCIASHTGQPAGDVLGCWQDEQGKVYLHAALGWGLVHSMDVHQLAELMDAKGWEAQPIASQELPGRGGYVQSPCASHPQA